MKGQVVIAFFAIVGFFLAMFFLASAAPSFNTIVQNNVGILPLMTEGLMNLVLPIVAILLAVIFFIQLRQGV